MYVVLVDVRVWIKTKRDCNSSDPDYQIPFTWVLETRTPNFIIFWI